MRVYLRTFGCRANHYDSEAIRALVEGAGHRMAATATDADVAVFNSCAVTTEAEVELRKVVRRTARANPRIRSVITGCAAALSDQARDPHARLAVLPTVVGLVGGADLPAIAGVLDLPLPDRVVYTSRQTSTRALLRIQDGCDEHCTFCATTVARGANRSRAPNVLVREAAELAKHHAEIVITGVHIGTYGADIGSSLGALLMQLVRDVPGVRFRLSSLEASEVDAPVRELFGEPSRLVPHLHAPLQSGSDRILRRMGRHWYTRRTYVSAIERLLAGRDTFGLGADVIAGFPGETDADHAATLEVVAELPFTYLHVFPYSPRPGTAATRMPSAVPAEVIKERARELREVGATKAAAYADCRVGQRADVIVVGGGVGVGVGVGPDARQGLTGDYLDVRVHGELPRGRRFDARLHREGGALFATEVPQATLIE